jgi:protocatechuate 3,4-dioxygenase beta subunit
MKPFVMLIALLLFQQPPSPDAATVEGFVTKIGTGDPVARARVALTTESRPPVTITATTDGGGKFVFQNVAAGRYRLVASRDGFVQSEYGSRGPGLAGTPLTVAARQDLKDVRIQVTPTGAIAGRVFDKYGDPVGNAMVQALKYSYQDGIRVLNVAQSIRTNDLGEYRLFWMQPGSYIVSAVPQDNRLMDGFMTLDLGNALPNLGPRLGGAIRIAPANGAAAYMGSGPAGPDSGETYLTVYYPGTTDAAAAAPIDLRPGANFTGVDLSVVDTRAVRIRGRVVTNRPDFGGISLSLIPRGTVTGNALLQRGTPVTDQGAFEFKGVAPGAYDVVATSGPQFFSMSESAVGAAGERTVTRQAFVFTTPGGGPAEAGGSAAARADEPRLFGKVSLEVGTADVENLTIALQTGFKLTGRVSIEGPGMSEAALANMHVQLRSDPPIPQFAPVPAAVSSNGTFTVTDLMPGDYRLSLSGLPRGGYVKNAAMPGMDSPNLNVRMEGEPRGALEVVVGTSPGSLEAVVQTEKQEAAGGVTVVLVPEAPRRLRSELYRSTTSDAAGRVRLDNVVPGNYKLFAWEVVEAGAWQDPDFLRIYEERGKVVRITEGSRETTDIRLIPYR